MTSASLCVSGKYKDNTINKQDENNRREVAYHQEMDQHNHPFHNLQNVVSHALNE
jgi:hypothetical protein